MAIRDHCLDRTGGDAAVGVVHARICPSGQPKVRRRTAETIRLFAPMKQPMRLMAQKWRTSFGPFDPSVISFAIDHQLLSRMMIFGVKSEPERSGVPLHR